MSRWTEYRQAMIDYAGIAVFVFGNKRDGAKIVPSMGMREEFDLCVASGLKTLPVGATGFMAETLWNEVSADFAKHFPGASGAFKSQFKKLGDASKTPVELLAILESLIKDLQEG